MSDSGRLQSEPVQKQPVSRESQVVQAGANRARSSVEALWLAMAPAAGLFLAVRWRLGSPVWALQGERLTQVLVALAGVLLSVILLPARHLTGRAKDGILRAVVVVLVFSLLALVPRAVPSLPLSRSLLVIAGAATLACALTPVILRDMPWPLPTLALAALAVALFRPAGAVEVRWVDATLNTLRLRTITDTSVLAASSVEGGGLSAAGNLLLLGTGDGSFFALRSREDSLIGERVPIPSPANRTAFADEAGEGVGVQWFRVADVLLYPVRDSIRLAVSHHFWLGERQCFVLRVSETAAAASADLPREWTSWRTRFETSPCLPIRRGARGVPFAGSQAGGRMVRYEDGILLATGDHQFDGVNATEVMAQDTATDYGKTILLPDSGGSTLVSLGHRNPQGLVRDARGRIWLTEHGPRGGDELNLVRRGADFGWPYATFGTEYSLKRWPLSRDSSAWTAPAFSWVPSVGISNILEVTSPRFPEWHGDLLAATLKARSLLRIRLTEDRPVYVEPLLIGYEIRDLHEMPDGRLLLWTDEGRLVLVSPEASAREGAAIFEQCINCHSIQPGQNGGLGPNLLGVVGRDVAVHPQFDYSAALRKLGGRWTRERLDAYLTDPSGYAPGTAMSFGGIKDSTARRILIDWLAVQRDD